MARSDEKLSLAQSESAGDARQARTDAEHLSRYANPFQQAQQDRANHHKHHQPLKGHINTTLPYLQDLQITGLSSPHEHTHTVKKGETLTAIAREVLGKGASEQAIYQTVQEIVRENQIKNPDLILPNIELKLPDSLTSGERTPPAENTQPKPAVNRPETREDKENHPANHKSGVAHKPEHQSAHKSNQPAAHKAEQPIAHKPAHGAADKPHQNTPAKPDTTPKQPEQTHLTQAALDKAAQDIHDAAYKQNLWGHGWSTPDAAPIKTILATMNEADRAALQKAYENKFHTSLQTDVQKQFKDDAVATSEINSLMARKDGKSDESGQIHNALAKLEGKGPVRAGDSKSDAAKAEAEIRNSLSTLTAKQIEEVKKTYQQNYGHSLTDDLSNDSHISGESKQALAIYLKGTDHRSSEDTAKLAQIGLDAKRLDIFQESMAYATPEARQAFVKNGGQQKIDQAFSGSDAQLAHDYAKNGAISLVTMVNGDHHFWHTNKDEINRAIEHCSNDEKKNFQLGKQLADSGRQPKTDEQKEALSFYNDTEKAFQNAGNAREAQIWTAKLNGSESIVTNILSTQHDGLLGIGKGHDKDDLYKAIENISEQDRQSLKDHPEHLRDVNAALQTICDDNERNKLMGMLQEKLNASSYAESQKVGQRGLSEALSDAGTDASKQVDALTHMSAADREKYRANTDGFADKINQQVQNIKGDGARYASTDILSQVKAGKEPQLSAVDRVAMDSMKNDSPIAAVNDMEAAFKGDSALLNRIKNPQTDADKQLANIFQGALNNAVDKAGLGAQSCGEGAVVPSQYPEFAKTLLETGHLPIEQKMQLLNGDKQATLTVLQTATSQERAALLNQSPDAKTKELQDAVLGNGAERQLYLNVLQQGKLTAADQLRAFALGINKDSSSQLSLLTGMSPEAKQATANEYFTKYGSMASEDVVAQAKQSEKFRFVELLSPTHQSIRQTALDAQVENDSHSSSFDGVMKSCWDYSGVAAQENSRQLNKFLAQHASEVDNLKPEQRKQFEDAVANYMQAQQNYVDSKGAAAEDVVDAAITVAAIGGAVFTGGTSLAMLSAIGVGGAVFRVGAMKALEGSDFDSSAHGILEQAFKGGTGAMLGFVGPEMFGIKGLAAVGEAVAVRTTAEVMEKAAAQGIEDAAFRGGEEAAKKTISDGLAALTRREAIAGEQGSEAAIKKIADKALSETATAEERAALEQTIRQELRSQVTKTLRDKIINESEAMFLNVATASGTNATTEVLSTAVGLSDPKTLFQRMQQAAVSGAAGAALFHVAFRAATLGFHGTRAVLGKDEKGLFAGEGTKIQHADGTETTVKPKERYRFKSGDQVVEQEKTSDDATATGDKAKPSKENKSASGKDASSEETKSAVGKETPGRFSTKWTDSQGREWTRPNIRENKWQASDGSTYSQSSDRQEWHYADGKQRVRYKSGEDYSYDPKTNTWTDQEGTKIKVSEERTTRLKTDGTKIEELKNGSVLTIKDGRVSEIVAPNGKSIKYEYSELFPDMLEKVTFSDGRTFKRLDFLHFKEQLPPGDARAGKIIRADYEVNIDGQLVVDDGMTETTFSPEGTIARHASAQIFEVRGNVSKAFQNKIDDAVLYLPPEVRQLLRDKGMKIVVGDSVPAIDPSMSGVRPRGWEEGGTWDNADGYYDSRKQIAVVTEHLLDANGNVIETNRGDGVLRHEVGHAVDAALGDFRNSPEFIDAYARDRANIEAHLTADEQKRLRYFLQQDGVSGDQNAGRSEAFAELFGILEGGGASYWERELIEKAFPNTIKAIRERLAALKANGN